MARQRCTIAAIADAADPVTVLRQYQQLAATTKDMVFTDIPRSALDDFVDLAFRVQKAHIRSVVFDPALINPAYPDYDEMRQIVQTALQPSGGGSPSSAPAPSSTSASAPPSASASPSASPSGSAADPATDVADACVYDAAAAKKALAQGEPPSKAN
jgi:polyisoprenyl-teichoic acid--peptidoglycan teichoic acid transferase